MTNPENPDLEPPEFNPQQPKKLTPEQARQANQIFLQGQGMEQAGAETEPAQQYPINPVPERGSFFGALFDFSFRRYVTPSVAAAIYAVLFIVIGASGAVALLGAVSVLLSDQPFGMSLLFFVLAVPPIVLVTIAVLALCRVYLEVAVSLIRTSQSVQAIDARQEQRLRAMRREQARKEGMNLPGQARIDQGTFQPGQAGPAQHNPAPHNPASGNLAQQNPDDPNAQ